MRLSLLSLISFMGLFATPIFAVEIPEEYSRFECLELNIMGRTEFERTAIMTYKNEVKPLADFGATKFFTLTYTSGNLPAGIEYLISTVIASRNGLYLSDENSSSKKYFMDNCGEYKELAGEFYWFTATGEDGPQSCLICNPI